MKFQLRRKQVFVGLMAVFLMGAVPNTNAFALTSYYNQTTQEIVTKGVTYETNSRITEAGVQNIHVLEVDLLETTLEIKGVDSAVEYGLKETTHKMLKENGAIAGVNGDFFGMSGTHSAPFGPVIENGEVISVGTYLNHEKEQYAAFFMDEENNPFFDYFKMSLKFSNAAHTLELASMNKITSMVYPIYFDIQAGETTENIDKRFEHLVKFVVEEEQITYISSAGEVVHVPEGGYLVVMSESFYTDIAIGFIVGDKVGLEKNASVDLDVMETGFGGGSLLLKDGQEAIVTEDLPKGRHPRTAFGISQDGTKAIFMVVDGRGHSIGASHEELAVLMQEYGGYNAMHLDGGGSSTMVVNTIDDIDLETKNKISDSTERKIINSVGIFQTAPIGEIQEIKIVPSMTRVVPNKEITFTVYGLDEYYNRIEILPEEVVLDAIGVEGTWNGYNFTPTTTGEFAVSAVYKELGIGVSEIVSATTSRLIPPAEIKLGKAGEIFKIGMQLIDTEGFVHWVSSTTQYEVADPSIGEMNGNVFTAKGDGSTYIKCMRDGQEAYIQVQVGEIEEENKVEKPNNTVLGDPLKGSVAFVQDGAYYVNISGKLAYTGEAEIEESVYSSQRDRVRQAVDSNAQVAIFGGKNDVQTPPTLDTLSWNGGYHFLDRGGVSVAMLSTAKGSIGSTDPTQYTKLAANLDGTENNTIMIIMENTPSDFSSKGEMEFFRSMLAKYESQGKEIFVISCSGVGQWTSVKDGVRYINLPNLWKADGTPNENFSMMKLRVDGEHITYEIVKV